MDAISRLCRAYASEDPNIIADATSQLMRGECSTATDAVSKIVLAVDHVKALASWSDADAVQSMAGETVAALEAVASLLMRDADADALAPLRELFGTDAVCRGN